MKQAQEVLAQLECTRIPTAAQVALAATTIPTCTIPFWVGCVPATHALYATYTVLNMIGDSIIDAVGCLVSPCVSGMSIQCPSHSKERLTYILSGKLLESIRVNLNEGIIPWSWPTISPDIQALIELLNLFRTNNLTGILQTDALKMLFQTALLEAPSSKFLQLYKIAHELGFVDITQHYARSYIAKIHQGISPNQVAPELDLDQNPLLAPITTQPRRNSY